MKDREAGNPVIHLHGCVLSYSIHLGDWLLVKNKSWAIFSRV